MCNSFKFCFVVYSFSELIYLFTFLETGLEVVLKLVQYAGLLLVGLLFVSGCAVNPVTGRNELNVMSVTTDQEISLGRASYAQALQKMGGVYPDTELNRYVDRVGQRLARRSHRPELKYHFKIVNDSTPNAFALPGGYIAITRGLLVSMENEAQLAAVLAHEIGHVTARHSVQEMQRSSLFGTAVGLLGSLAGESGYGQLLNQVGGLTANLLSKRYSRDQEYEADRLSVDYLVSAGYSVQGAIELQDLFMRKLESGSNPHWISGLFRTHPFSQERLVANRNYIESRYPSFRVTYGLDRVLYSEPMATLLETREAYALYDQAREAEGRKQYNIAIETYHKAMQKAPEHGLLLTALGMAYLRSEDLVPAKRYLIKAIQADPDYFQSRLGLGYIYLQGGRLKDAVKHLDASIKLLPTLQGTYLLADAEERSGNLGRAVTLYEIVVENDRDGNLGQAAAAKLRSLNR